MNRKLKEKVLDELLEEIEEQDSKRLLPEHPAAESGFDETGARPDMNGELSYEGEHDEDDDDLKKLREHYERE
jgi:hypothetical protein